MSHDSAAKIKAWFDEHDDGEFSRYPRAAAFQVVAPHTAPSVVIIATKQHAVLSAIEEGLWGADFGVIARYGLPNSSDVEWIRAFVAPHKTYFLGDMDPPDLMNY